MGDDKLAPVSRMAHRRQNFSGNAPPRRKILDL
jgi:hypothetical protein